MKTRMNPTTFHLVRPAPGLILLLALTLSSATAQGASTSTWIGTTADFSNPTSWGGTEPAFPADGSTVVYNDLTLDFDGSGSTAYTATNDLVTGQAQLLQLNLDSTASVAETISGSNLTFVGTAAEAGSAPVSGITQSGSGAFIISSDIVLPAKGGTGTLNLANSGGATGVVTLSGIISGPATTVNVESGNWVISGNNTYGGVNSGRYQQLGGTVDIQNANAFGSSTTSSGNSFGPWLQGSGATEAAAETTVVESTTGVTLATYSGEKTSGLGVGGIAIGSLTLTGPGNWSLGSSTFVLRGTSVNDIWIVDTAGSTGTTIAGALVNGSTASSLTIDKLSTGTLTLNGPSTYSGGTTINGGIVNLTGTSSAGFTLTGTTTTSNTITISSTAGLAPGQTVSGTGIPAGTVITTITDSTHFTISNNATASGTNSLTFGNYSGLGTGAITIGSGGTLSLSSNALAAGAGNMTISGAGFAGQTGALVNATGTNTYSGLITLGAASTISSDAGTLDLTNTGTVTGAFGLTLAGASNGTVASVIGTGTGSVTKNGAGAWTLAGASTYSGGTTVNTGALILANSSGSATGSGTVSVVRGATLAGTGASSGSSFALGATGSGTTTVLVGQNATTANTDTNTLSNLTLTGSTGTSSIANTHLVFNLNAQTAGGFGSGATGAGVINSGNELLVGNTAVSFGSAVQLTLVLQNEPAIIPANTPYVLFAGNIGAGNPTQYSGLTFGTSTTVGSVTTTQIEATNLTLSFLSPTDTEFYGADSYLFLYQDSATGVDDIDVEVIPEPGTWALMFIGFGLLVVIQRRRNKLD